MTTYRYDISLDDTECIAMKEALKMYLLHCEEQLVDGAKAPFWSHKKSMEQILSRLYLNTTQTSGNSFFND